MYNDDVPLFELWTLSFILGLELTTDNLQLKTSNKIEKISQ